MAPASNTTYNIAPLFVQATASLPVAASPPAPVSSGGASPAPTKQASAAAAQSTKEAGRAAAQAAEQAAVDRVVAVIGEAAERVPTADEILGSLGNDKERVKTLAGAFKVQPLCHYAWQK